jgi:hypothetical protein
MVVARLVDGARMVASPQRRLTRIQNLRQLPRTWPYAQPPIPTRAQGPSACGRQGPNGSASGVRARALRRARIWDEGTRRLRCSCTFGTDGTHKLRCSCTLVPAVHGAPWYRPPARTSGTGTGDPRLPARWYTVRTRTVCAVGGG